MKKVIYIIIFISATTSLLSNAQIIESFVGTPTNNNAVIIEWKTIAEKNVSRFELQRLANGTFKTITHQTAKGVPSSYKFTDSDSFTKDISSDNIQSANFASYRIKIVYSNNTPDSYTDEITVPRGISSIKRTLGMLKEMFK